MMDSVQRQPESVIFLNYFSSWLGSIALIIKCYTMLHVEGPSLHMFLFSSKQETHIIIRLFRQKFLFKPCRSKASRRVYLPHRCMAYFDLSHEGNTEDKNNGYVVLKLNIRRSAGKQGGGESAVGKRAKTVLFFSYNMTTVDAVLKLLLLLRRKSFGEAGRVVLQVKYL